MKYVANKDKLVDIQWDNTFKRAFLKSSKKARYKPNRQSAYYQVFALSLTFEKLSKNSHVPIKAVELIQVAYEVDSQRAYDRETSSLVKASDALSCKRLTLIAFTQTRVVVVDGKTIHIVSALEWLLQ